jgi:hypothetical protein
MTITKKVFRKKECTWYIECDKCGIITIYRTNDNDHMGLDTIIGWRKPHERVTHRLGDRRDICGNCYCKHYDQFKDLINPYAWLDDNYDDGDENNYNSETIMVDLPLTIWMKEQQ